MAREAVRAAFADDTVAVETRVESGAGVYALEDLTSAWPGSMPPHEPERIRRRAERPGD
jgi:hypothetical protein